MTNADLVLKARWFFAALLVSSLMWCGIILFIIHLINQ